MPPPISADEAALLRTVCLDPWDDPPRLVIADWYEENGQGLRAGLIRAECDAARDPTPAAIALAGAALDRLTAARAPADDEACGVAGRAPRHRRGWFDRAEFRLGAVPVRGRPRPVGPRPHHPGHGGRESGGAPPAAPAVDVGAVRGRAGLGQTGAARRVRPAGPPGVARRDVPVGETAGYPTAPPAEEALSRALVDEGRAAAGLPPLAWPAFEESPA